MNDKCAHCGKQFKRSKFDDGRKRFCSVLCQYKEWRKRNPERAKKISQKTKEKNREKIRLWNREYGLKHKKERRIQLLNWRRKNKAKAVQQVLLRRYRAMGVGGKHTLEEWEALKRKYLFRCAICKKRKPLTRDHMIPITKGGTNDISNIQPLCRQCNSRKFNHI
jgi:5-methylcytosine-specific restriction endonuclease McrA